MAAIFLEGLSLLLRKVRIINNTQLVRLNETNNESQESFNRVKTMIYDELSHLLLCPLLYWLQTINFSRTVVIGQ